MELLASIIFFYAGVVVFVIAVLGIYAIYKTSKLEKRHNGEIVYTYFDNFKNIIPFGFLGVLISFTIVLILFLMLSYFIFGVMDLLLIEVSFFIYGMFIYIMGLKKYKVEVFKDRFFFIQFFSWGDFKRYEKIGGKIKLIGKRYTSPDSYLKDKDRKLEEILKKYFNKYQVE